MSYNFERYPSFILSILVVSIVPVSSVLDLLSDGHIALDAVTETRREIPLFLLYSFGWLIFTFVFFWAYVPAWRYIKRGYIFKIFSDSIFIDDVIIKKNHIVSWKETFWGLKLNTNRGVYFFHPRLSKSGIADFQSFFEDVSGS